MPLVDDIQTCAPAAKGDPDATEKGDRRLLELKLLLDEIENELKASEKANEIRGWLDDLDRLVLHRIVLEVGGGKACVFGDPREHLRSYLSAIVECEDKIWPAVTF